MKQYYIKEYTYLVVTTWRYMPNISSCKDSCKSYKISSKIFHRSSNQYPLTKSNLTKYEKKHSQYKNMEERKRK